MKSFRQIIRESNPTLLVFEHAGNKDAIDTEKLIEEIKAKYAGRANVVTVDASRDGNLKIEYKLEEYPTYILFKEGQELMRESGKKSIGDLSDMIGRGL